MSALVSRTITSPSLPAQLLPDLTVIEAVRHFSDERNAEQWFVEQLWPNGLACPFCGSISPTRTPTRKPMPFWCHDCRKYFSVRTGTPMARSNVSLSKWAMATYFYVTRPKGISSVQLGKDVGVSQRTAWFMLHRLREGGRQESVTMQGPVEVDEALVGGIERFKHADKKLHERWYSGKMKVVGIVDRPSNRLVARVTNVVDSGTLQWFIRQHTNPRAMIYTDQAAYYLGLPLHGSVNHSKGQYVDGDITTNAIESVWAILKRMWHGTYHWFSRKHVQRYLFELEARHNLRPLSPLGRMSTVVRGMVGRSMSYRELVDGRDGYNGFDLLNTIHATKTKKAEGHDQDKR